MPGIGPRAAMTALAICLGGTMAACGGEARPAAKTPAPTPSTPSTQETPLRILPGSRHGLGSTLPFARPGQVADIKVEVTETTWTTDRSEGRFTALKAGGVRTQRESAQQATLRFGVDSGFTKPVPVMRVSALFRDPSGRIIGGADDLRQEESFKNVLPGRAPFQFAVGDGLPAGTADERTEIHVHPVLFPVG